MTVDEWLTAYGESHQNPTNELIHWICVPTITVTLVAFLSLVSLEGVPVNGAHVFLLLALAYYFHLSVPLALGMIPVAGLILAAVWALGQLPFPLPLTAGILFFLAWVGQFIGHKIEGKKPSFFRDLQFLLIGPLWLLSHVYRRWNIRYS